MASPKSLFDLGHVCATPAALAAFEASPKASLRRLLYRHVTGDWGDLSDEDKAENDYSVGRYLRILSAYHLDDGTKMWVITEADRSVTTFLLPSDY